MRTALLLASCLIAASSAHGETVSDEALVRMCVEEMKSRQPADEVQANTQVVASKVERSERQVVVSVQVTEAEGRRVAARCVVRGGKVFDYREE